MTVNERLQDVTEDAKAKAKFWQVQIDQASKHERPWRTRGEEIIKRYRDEEQAMSQRRYNMLWANTQLNIAALMGQIPEADVARRWMTDNAVVRDGAEVMENSIKSALDDRSQERCLVDAVLEGVLPGRGVVRVRYNADMETVEIPAPMPEFFDTTALTPIEPIIEERKKSERVYLERVYWQDYRESPARSQEDVWWRAFRDTTMDRDALIERFGDKGRKIPLNIKGEHGEAVSSGVDEDTQPPHAFGRADIWEIWDKRTGNVIWIAKGYDEIIQEEPPALTFERFFDCADPLVLYRTTDNNIPLPEYTFYQDLARELDELQDRIAKIVSVLKVGGLYHGIMKDFPRLAEMTDGHFSATSEDAMFPLDGNSGLDKMIATLPIEKWAGVLPILISRVEMLKAAIFEITGFSDLLRGQTHASETLGAQNLKAQFGSFRLLPKQRVVQAWLEETYNLVGEVIAEMFDAETITKITGIGESKPFVMPEMPDGIDQQQAQMIAFHAEAQWQAQQEADQAHFDEVIAFLRDQQMRTYRANIELDELARPDRSAMQQQASLFMQGAAQYVTAIAQMPKELMPPLLAAFKTWARNFKLGKDVEELLDDAIEGIGPAMEQAERSAAEQAQQPAPDAQLRAQTDIEIANIRATLEREKEQMKAELQLALKQADAQLSPVGGGEDEIAKIQAELEKVRLKEEADTQRALMKEQAETERAREREAANLEIARMREESAMARTCKQEEGALNRELVKLDGMGQLETLKASAAMDREKVKVTADLEREGLRASTSMACEASRSMHDRFANEVAAQNDVGVPIQAEALPPQPIFPGEELISMMREQRSQADDIVSATHALGRHLAESVSKAALMSQEELALRSAEIEEQRRSREEQRLARETQERIASETADRQTQMIQAQTETTEAIKSQTEEIAKMASKKRGPIKITRDQMGNIQEISPSSE